MKYKILGDCVKINFDPIRKFIKAKDRRSVRTIISINHAAKILLLIVLITPLIEACLNEIQLGFRKSKGTRGSSFTIRIMKGNL